MKHFYSLFIMTVLMLSLTSCYTTTKFTIDALPGTEILTPDYTRIAVADNNGKAKVKIDDDEFYAFLLSHQPNTQDYVPLALDYKYKSYIGTQIQYWGGLYLSCLGLIPIIAGTVAIAQDDEDLAGPFWGGGLALEALGMGMGMPAYFRAEQRSYDNQYKFLSQQRTNQDLPISKPQLVSETTSKKTPIQQKQTDSPEESSTVSHRKVSQQSTKTLKDYGAQLQGTYIGTGKLTKTKEIIESYKDIMIVLNRVTKDVVNVNVVESNGEKFFPSDSRYNIIKKNDGSFELTLEGISSAQITIDKEKNINYSHPRVNIDGDIYTLSIEGRWKK